MLAEADMRAEAEGDLLVPFAFGVEGEGVAEHILVAVGRYIVQHQPVALADRLAADFDVFLRAAHEMLDRRRPADRLLDQPRLVALRITETGEQRGILRHFHDRAGRGGALRSESGRTQGGAK